MSNEMKRFWAHVEKVRAAKEVLKSDPPNSKDPEVIKADLKARRAARQVCYTEGDSVRMMRDMLPEEWARRIASLPEHLRHAAAVIVWWDHFGGRNSHERWDHLDEYANKPLTTQPDQEELMLALCKVGYAPAHAHRRVLIMEHEAYENESEVLEKETAS
jgi:hypothetical protein